MSDTEPPTNKAAGVANASRACREHGCIARQIGTKPLMVCLAYGCRSADFVHAGHPVAVPDSKVLEIAERATQQYRPLWEALADCDGAVKEEER